MTHSIRALLATTIALCLLLAVVPDGQAAVGLRGGLSIDPDQVVGGVHFGLPAVGRSLYIVPSAEAGFGDDSFTLAGNGDLQYRFQSAGKVRPYAGGGLSIFYVDVDNGGSDTELGVSALGGIFFSKLFAEAKLGITNLPDWKFVLGVLVR